MEYCYSISKFQTFDFKQAERIFPDNFQLNTKNDKTFLIVTTENTSGSEVFIEVQRECDRVSFLTGEQLNPQFQYIKNAEGIKTCQQCIVGKMMIVSPLPQNIDKQQWDLTLTVQLRLWQLAGLPNLPIAARINLLFQIIEIAFPCRGDKTSYPEYPDSNVCPHPRKESLLLRDLVSHGKGEIRNADLKTYCNFLKVNESLHDLTDSNFMEAVEKRFNIIRDEAYKVINKKITLNE